MKLILSFILGTLFVASVVHCKYVDLTYALNKDTVLWPGRKNTFNTEIEAETPDAGWIASRGFCISEHSSTHIDAPYHFNKQGWTLSHIPLESLLDIPGVCIDVYDKVHKFKNGELEVIQNYVLTRDDILEWEAKNGVIPANALVLVRTGWGSRWPNADDYKGTPKELRTTTEAGTEANNTVSTVSLDASSILNFPGFDSTAAVFLTSERNVLGVGIDTLSIDAGKNSKKFPAHKIFTKKQVYMLENVANLQLLPSKGFRLFAVPFKVDEGTGSPTRLIAKLADVNSY